MQEEVDRRHAAIHEGLQTMWNQMTAQGKSSQEIGDAADLLRARLYQGIPDGVYYYGVRVGINHRNATNEQLTEWLAEQIENEDVLNSLTEGATPVLVRITFVPGEKRRFDIIYKTKKPLPRKDQESFATYMNDLDEDGNYPINGKLVNVSFKRELEQDEIEEVRQRNRERKGTAEIAVAKNMPPGMFSKEVGKYLGGKTQRKWKMPRKYTRKYCKKTPCRKMGFTQRSSCRPYKNCF